jgi:hypothetical protein
MPVLPGPPSGRDDLVAWVGTHLGQLTCDEVRPSPIRGGQDAADAALAGLNLTGYATRRSTVLPAAPRGDRALAVHPARAAAAAGGVGRGRRGAGAGPAAVRYQLLWQEYARHLYARVGVANGAPLRFASPAVAGRWEGKPWPERMACMAGTTTELYGNGWLVNQTRMWLSSEWAVAPGSRRSSDERDGPSPITTTLTPVILVNGASSVSRFSGASRPTYPTRTSPSGASARRTRSLRWTGSNAAVSTPRPQRRTGAMPCRPSIHAVAEEGTSVSAHGPCSLRRCRQT